VDEIRIYIACEIYMGLHPEGDREAYWNQDPQHPIHQAIHDAIQYKRYCQIDRYFHLMPPCSPGETAPPWEKVSNQESSRNLAIDPTN